MATDRSRLDISMTPSQDITNRMKVPATFRHEPLFDLTLQIRLFRIQPGRTSLSIEVELSSWDLKYAPRYHAISYTWGDDEKRVISVNGLSFVVRHNCHYALWQVRRRFTGCYIWMDSICIDQAHRQEKSHQVSVMKAIYERADLVLACIGPHENDSDLCIDVIKLIRSASSDTEAAPRRREFKIPRLDPWLSCLTDKELARLRTSLAAFSNRRYWSRLWIVQEIAAMDVRFFCGTDVFSWNDFNMVVPLSTHRLINAGYGALTIPPEPLPLYPPASLSLDDALFLTRMCECSDPRDHVFGILALLRWPLGSSPIIPDYDKSCFEVAAEALGHTCRLETAFRLFRMLDLSCSQPDFQDLKDPWQRRQMETISVQAHSTMSSRLRTNAEGDLAASVVSRNLDDNSSSSITTDWWERAENVTRDWSASNARDRPKPLMGSKGPVGYLCRDAAPGDIIVHLEDNESSLLLIVRENADGSYDVFGQGFLLPHYEISRDKDQSPEPAVKVDCELTLTVADILFLVGQDIDHGMMDAQVMVGRLNNNPFSSPLGAVTIRPNAG